MDKLIIQKIWQEENLIELYIYAKSEYISVTQKCYIEINDLEKNAEHILQYTQGKRQRCYVEFGNKEGNYTPAFSMEFLPKDKTGHIKVEMDIEIDDNDERRHRCKFYVDSENNVMEELGEYLLCIARNEEGIVD